MKICVNLSEISSLPTKIIIFVLIAIEALRYDHFMFETSKGTEEITENSIQQRVACHANFEIRTRFLSLKSFPTRWPETWEGNKRLK
jgi:hypothetical protein